VDSCQLPVLSGRNQPDPFKPNVIIIGEVTTAIIDFNYEELINLEKV